MTTHFGNDTPLHVAVTREATGCCKDVKHLRGVQAGAVHRQLVWP